MAGFQYGREWFICPVGGPHVWDDVLVWPGGRRWRCLKCGKPQYYGAAEAVSPRNTQEAG